MKCLQSLAFLVVIALAASMQHAFYVKPNDSALQDCPGQPCLTLDMFARQTDTYFTSGATFLFLAGNHSSHTTVHLRNISGVTFKGKEKDLVIYWNNVTISCFGVQNLTIEGLSFKSAHINNDDNPSSSVLEVVYSRDVWISNSIFQGSGDPSKGLVRAILANHSSISVANCLFRRNTGDSGGAIFAAASTISLGGST